MTTYTTIPNGDIDQDSPVTQPLLTALRDNPIATAEGASGSPVIFAGWHPYNLTEVGSTETGVIYDFSIDGTVASVESPNFADGFEYAFVFNGISSSAAATELRMSLYRDTDAAYFTDVSILSGLSFSTEVVQGIIQVQMPRLAKYVHSCVSLSIGHARRTDTGAVTVSGGMVASFNDATLQTTSKARFRFDSGNIDAGTITMLRRREYLTG